VAIGHDSLPQTGGYCKPGATGINGVIGIYCLNIFDNHPDDDAKPSARDHVYRRGGRRQLHQAAAALGQTKAVVSFNVRQLENELGVTLLLRSTRRLRLTDAGALFYQRGVALLKAAENLQDEVRASHSGLSGELRITTTPEYGAQVIIPALAAFARHHPALRVRHVSSSHHADLISERFDVAIRLGTLADSRYRATRIASFAILPVASPAWLASHPLQTLSDLAQADWIIHERLPAPLRWQLRTDEQAEVDFEIVSAPRFSADSATALMSFALAGCGVALLPAWLVAETGAAGAGGCPAGIPFPQQGVYALYPDAQHMPTRVRAFIDFLRG
jgi:DNA-binding transcriptional LysR family regulator